MITSHLHPPPPHKTPCFRPSHAFLLLLTFLDLQFPLSNAQPTPNSPPDQSPYQKLSPQMAIVIVILLAALFLMGFFSLYIRRCSDAPAGGNVRTNGNTVLGRSRRLTRGLDVEIINSFPTLAYSEVKEHKIGKGALECAVCLCEFEDGETLRFIPKCDHVFHPDCIDAWLSSHTTCPVCRANLVPQPGDTIPQLLHAEPDVEAQHLADPDLNIEDAAERPVVQESEPASVGGWLSKTLSRNRTRRSRSNRQRKFLRSHTTGHSAVQPGENTDRFTLRLPVEVRKQILNRELQRASSVVVLPREGSTRTGYRSGSVGGSSRGKFYQRLEKLDPGFKLDRWVFTTMPPFLTRAPSSVKTATPEDGESMEKPIAHPHTDSARPSI